jgi:hypothetical protein
LKLRVAAAIAPVAVLVFACWLFVRPRRDPVAAPPSIAEAPAPDSIPTRTRATGSPRPAAAASHAGEASPAPSGAVAGIVRADETDEPLDWIGVGCDLLRPDGTPDEIWTFTDERGAYRLDDVLGTLTSFDLLLTSQESVTLPADSLRVAAGETVARDLRVSIRPFVAGVVVDLGSGAPIPNACVEAGTSNTRAALADEAGRFRLLRLTPAEGTDSVRIAVSHPDYLDLETLVDPRSTTSGAVRLALRRGSALSGTVLDARGTPVAARLELGCFGRILAMADGDEDGAFAFRGLPPVRCATLVARVGGGDGAPRGSVTIADLDLRGGCTGLVLRADDPCTARIDPQGDRWRFDATPRVRRIDVPTRGWTGPQDLEAGTYVVDWVERLPTVVDVRPGDVLRGEVGSALRAGKAWVSGDVVDGDDLPVAEFAIETDPPGRRLGEEDCPWLASRPGGFELEVPADRPLKATFRDDRGRTAVEEIVAPPFEHVRLRRVVLH